MQGDLAATGFREPAGKIRARVAAALFLPADQLVDVEFFGTRALCEFRSSGGAGKGKEEFA